MLGSTGTGSLETSFHAFSNFSRLTLTHSAMRWMPSSDSDRLRCAWARRDPSAGRPEEDRVRCDGRRPDHADGPPRPPRRHHRWHLDGSGGRAERRPSISRAGPRPDPLEAGLARPPAPREHEGLPPHRPAHPEARRQGGARTVPADSRVPRHAPRVARLRQSLVLHFEQPRAEECVARLEASPTTRPRTIGRSGGGFASPPSCWAIFRIRSTRGTSPRRWRRRSRGPNSASSPRSRSASSATPPTSTRLGDFLRRHFSTPSD